MPWETTRALVYLPQTGRLEIRPVPLPRVEVDEVLVRILKVGLTRKDAGVIANPAPHLPEGDDFLILGHVALGQVAEAGALVRHLSPGDLVVPLVRRDSGHCIDGRSDLCPHPEKPVDAGLAGAHGFARELLVEKGHNLVRLPREAEEIGILLPHLAAAEKAHRDMSECRQRFQFFCYHDEDPAAPAALITGLGPTGILLCYLLSLHNYKVTAFGRREADDSRAGILAPLGVEYLNTRRYPISHLARGGTRFRILFETTGDPAYLLDLLSLVGKGSVLALMGAPLGEASLTVDAAKVLRQVVEGNLVVLGSTKAGRDAYESGARQLVELWDLYSEHLAPLTGTVLPFEQYAQALSLDSRRTLLPILELA